MSATAEELVEVLRDEEQRITELSQALPGLSQVELHGELAKLNRAPMVASVRLARVAVVREMERRQVTRFIDWTPQTIRIDHPLRVRSRGALRRTTP